MSYVIIWSAGGNTSARRGRRASSVTLVNGCGTVCVLCT